MGSARLSNTSNQLTALVTLKYEAAPCRVRQLFRQAQRWRSDKVHVANIGPKQPPVFFNRITRERQARDKLRLDTFDGHGAAFAVARKLESVVPAGQPVVHTVAQRQLGTSMGTAIRE